MEHTEKSQRVVTFLNRDEVDFLDTFGKDALFSTGAKLSRTKLIAWMVDLAKSLNISGKGIISEQDFDTLITNTIRQNQTPPATEGFSKNEVHHV